jgi:hypothetical protein
MHRFVKWKFSYLAIILLAHVFMCAVSLLLYSLADKYMWWVPWGTA